MPEKIDRGIYRLEIPPPRPNLDPLNSYVVKDGGEVLLVDLGFDSDEALDRLRGELEQLDLGITDVTHMLGTHFHLDHITLLIRLRAAGLGGAELMLGTADHEFIKRIAKGRESHLRDLLEMTKSHGMPGGQTEEFVRQVLGQNESIYEGIIDSVVPMEGGERLEIGDHCFELIDTPGHSPGHLCLYEAGSKLFLSGDHVLPYTTPTVIQWERERPLANYLESLERVKSLEVDMVLPAHGEPFRNHEDRIDEIMEHHKERLEEAESLLRGNELSAYQLAPKLSWNVEYSSWSEMPFSQKWLATGETLAHLKLLQDNGEVDRVEREGLVLYGA